MAGIIQKLVEATGKSSDEIKKLLNIGSQTAPTLLKEADETLPAVTRNLQPELIEPQVIGKGTSRAAPAAGNVIDADLVAPKVSTLDAVKEFAKQNKGKIAGGLTLAELSRQMMSGGDQTPTQPSMAAKQAGQPVMSDELHAAAIDEANNQNAPISPVRKALGVDASDQIEAAAPEAPASEEPDFVKMLQDAQETSKYRTAGANFLRGAEQAGAGLSRTKAEYGGSDAALKQAGQSLEDVKSTIGAHKEQLSYNKAIGEINDDKALADPNSEVSKLTSELAAKAGLIKPGTSMSAASLKSSGVNLGNLLTTIEAGKARKESAQLQREQMASDKANTNQLKVQGGVDRQVTQLLKSKDMEGYNAAKDAIFALDSAMDSDDDKIKGGAAFMQYAKIAQGDNSVVRDGDMAQLAGKYNFTSVTEMFNKLKAQASGGNFGSDELAAMKEVAKKTLEIKGRRVRELMSPIVKRTGAAGLDITESLDPAVVKEFGPSGNTSESGPLTTQKGSRTFKAAQQPGSIVTVKSGKKYKIEADGVTGTEI